MGRFAVRRVIGLLFAVAALCLLVPERVGAQSTQIKPRILLIFDTSVSMAQPIDSEGATTGGDGSWDPWSPSGQNRWCCPGKGNSRLYFLKEAVRQMLFATGDIDFGLMKFAQYYVAGENPSTYQNAPLSYYTNNQVAGVTDKLRYYSSTCSPTFSAYTPGVPGSAYQWLCTEFPDPDPDLAEDNRGPILMWIDHHEFKADGSGKPDAVPVGWSRYGDLYEQEIRATSYTPIAASLLAAEDYLTDAYSDDYGTDRSTAICRPYSVILLTDGDETCNGNHTTAATALHGLEGTWGSKPVNIWVIGFAYSGDRTTLNQIASIGGTGTSRSATSEVELSGVLYDIVSSSRLVETCNYADDDCDGETDEGFRFTDRAYCNPYNSLGPSHPQTGTDPLIDRIVCVRPSEEACDGIDDNCDGVTDEVPDGLPAWPDGALCGGCDTSIAPCPNGPSAGKCAQGVEVCVPGVGYGCQGSVSQTPEVCNGVDDDCDGVVDDGLGSGACGACGDGTYSCVNGEMRCCGSGSTTTNCMALRTPGTEMCNGIDDDCDGATDEDLTRGCGGCATEAQCTGDPNEGVCAVGQQACFFKSGNPDDNGNWGVVGVAGACAGEVGPAADETFDTLACNNQDDDCDARTDEDYGIGEACGTCGGNLYCIAGAEVCCAGLDTNGQCVPVALPTPETCNGKDDDCDGQTDEDLGPRICITSGNESYDGIGLCHHGYQTCTAGQWGGISGGAWQASYCQNQQLPTAEVCNLLDDDCDGDTDESITGAVGCGACKDGHEECVSGAMQCVDARVPNPETCNGKDDDCDGATDEELSRVCMDEAYADKDGIGICHSGIETCKQGNWGFGETYGAWRAGVCGNQQVPTPEACDCLDNDCDGATDEAIGAPVGQACNLCGVWVCEACQLECNGFAQLEVCNGVDDNCNGLTDEGINAPCGGCTLEDPAMDVTGTYADCLAAQAATAAVGPDEGQCQMGARWCAPEDPDKWGECQGSIGPVGEMCDGKDNDCDAVTDEEEEIEHVNEQCATAVGICEDGWTRCIDNGVGGKTLACCRELSPEGLCIPPQGPLVEECNGLDDDCDGRVDEELPNVGGPCGPDLGVCEPGTVVCACTPGDPFGCEIKCVGQQDGTPEVCNDLDDDCDGQTDEDLPTGEGCTNAPEEVAVGECGDGFLECRMGLWVCNGTEPEPERCDGKDNDCDGLTDENLNVECPDGSVCYQGECAKQCVGQEMACPSGMTCREVPDIQGKSHTVCLTDVCSKGSDQALPCVENPNWCDEGEAPLCKCSVVEKRCVSLCRDISCPDNTICVPKFGQCRGVTDDCYTTGCPEGQVCLDGLCAADPCAGVSCSDSQYCNGSGRCVDPCMDRRCPVVCIDGQCADPCAAVACAAGQVCKPYTATCENPNACDLVTCEYYQVCQGGACVQDPCLNIECPNGFTCAHGSCFAFGIGDVDADADANTDTDTDSDLDADTDRDSEGDAIGDTTAREKNADTSVGMTNVLATGGGGCLCSSAPGASGMNGNGVPVLLAGLFLGLLRVMRRRRERLLLAMAVLPIMLLGCETHPYKFDQGDGVTGGDTATVGEGEGAESSSSAVDGGQDTEACLPDALDNDCDGVDDDCDGVTDEDVDLSTNSHHCGQCGHDCSQMFPNAVGSCQAGQCRMGDCATYFQNLNTDSKDGCEYFCEPKFQTDGCNGIDPGDGSYIGVDDDCDGKTDEDVDLLNDRRNCGICGHLCTTPHATGACAEGVCATGACDADFHDVDGTRETGCEYACRVTAPTELCNNRDDNCDGQTDEGNPDGGTPCYPLNEGCAMGDDGIFHCIGACRAGQETCVNGAMVCDGYTAPLSIEACNNLDDNCDGNTDENLYRSCRTPEIVYEQIGACQNGLQTCRAGDWGDCVNEVVPTAERCDDEDNDCDGETDEEAIEVGAPCGGSPSSADPNEGECQQGRTVCLDALVVCQGDVKPVQETCDNLDNDCDGYTDDNLTRVCGGCDPALYDYCAARNQGLCQPGVASCVAGVYANCVATITPQPELCDGLDNDCDGVTDEEVVGVGNKCGSCGGVAYCLHAQMACCAGLNGEGACIVPPTAVVETCNNRDDDCDGVTDNNLQLGLCDGPDSDACEEGIVACVNGSLGCTDNTGDNLEVCDGLDNDCDGATDEDDPDFIGAPPDRCDAGCFGYVDTRCNGVLGWQCEYLCAASDDDVTVDVVQCDAQGQVIGAETWCNGKDDNCDGLTDEGLTSSVENCGACHAPCDRDGVDEHVASWACVSGQCRVNNCATGWWNLVTTDPELCEYGCTYVGAENDPARCGNNADDDCDGLTDNFVSATEVCDGKDNDCDGQTDNIALGDRPTICNPNCPANSYTVVCDAGVWKCTYKCVGTPGGTVNCGGADNATVAATETLCDGLDNNCDGTVDEGFTLWNKSAVIGDRCTNDGVGACLGQGFVACDPNHTTYACCTNKTAVCAPADMVPLNPNDDAVLETAQGADGIDNDCDGYIDDGVTSCAATVEITESDDSYKIFQYEASRWNAGSGSGGSGGSVACSLANVLPWTDINFSEARAACLRLNPYEDGAQPCSYDNPDANDPTQCWDLCAAEQWYFSCAYGNPDASAPHLYPYGDAHVATTCNGVDFDADPSLIAAGSAPNCYADWTGVAGGNVWDLSGNVEEWTAEKRDVGSTHLRVVRGGSYNTLASGLTCGFDFLAAAEQGGVGAPQLGFRCCKGENPMTACEQNIDSLANYPYRFDLPGDAGRCRVDGWWATNNQNDQWEIGKTTVAAVGATSCTAGTNLNGTCANSRENYLHSPVLDLSSCVGQRIVMEWNMWLDVSSGDYLQVRRRTSTNGGATWNGWSNVGTSFTSNVTSWATIQSLTLVNPVQAATVYQVQFWFHSGASAANNYGAYLDNIRFVAQ